MRILILITTFLFTNLTFSQTVKITKNYGSSNPELQEIMDFQNIQVEKFNFENSNLRGKNFEINVSEYVNGKLKSKTLLCDTSEADFLKIQYSPFSLKMFTQMKNGFLTINAKFYNFSSKTLNLKLSEKNQDKDYVAKDFFGAKIVTEFPLQEEFPLLAIITPTIHKDGSGSYCEVVQSDIKPENLGEHFKIPHYFLVTMKIK